MKKMKLIENSLNASYNLQKVNWKDFNEHLQKTKDKMIVKMQKIMSLEAKVIYLIECIKNTVKLFVFKQRICVKSKLWWNNEFIEMQKRLSSRKRIWKRCRKNNAWAKIVQMRNSYHDAIKLIKNQFWINFLNNIEEKEVFQTYKFTKSRLIEKLFLILFLFLFYFFIKCMQSMTMTLSRCCVCATLHVIWSKSLLYIFSLINHIDSLHIQVLSLKLSQSYFRFSSFSCSLRVLLFRF